MKPHSTGKIVLWLIIFWPYAIALMRHNDRAEAAERKRNRDR